MDENARAHANLCKRSYDSDTKDPTNTIDKNGFKKIDSENDGPRVGPD